jgi:hypothetical protein
MKPEKVGKYDPLMLHYAHGRMFHGSATGTLVKTRAPAPRSGPPGWRGGPDSPEATFDVATGAYFRGGSALEAVDRNGAPRSVVGTAFAASPSPAAVFDGFELAPGRRGMEGAYGSVARRILVVGTDDHARFDLLDDSVNPGTADPYERAFPNARAYATYYLVIASVHQGGASPRAEVSRIG